MARFNPVQNSFVAGELTPRLEARDDLPQYAQGMRLAENGIVLPHGGFTRRSGTAFVAEVKDSTAFTRLIPFQFNVEQAYVCEFGNLYVRFYLNQGRLEIASVPVEVVTPYTTAQLQDLRWAQSNDVLYVVHPNVHPYQLNRTSPTSFTFTKVVFTIPPIRTFNVDDTMTIAISSTGTLATAAGFTFDETNDVGRVILMVEDVDSPSAPNEDEFVRHHYYTIDAVAVGGVTATTSKLQTVTRVGISDNLTPPDTIAAQDNFALGLFSDTEGATDVTFHEGRLVFAGAPQAPDRFVMSVSDDFLNFSLESPDLEDADNADRAISRRTVGSGQSSIRWLASTDQRLFIGTAGEEFAVQGANEDLVTPTGAVVRPLTARGSQAVAPIVIDSQAIFVSGRKLRQLIFDEESTASFRARDITILSEHLYEAGIREIVYQQDPDSVIWVIKNDGEMVGVTFEREQETVGAHRHTFSGDVETAAIIPTPDLIEDQPWVIVKRTIDGATKRYVEYIDKTYRPALTIRSTTQERIDAVADGRFLDSFLTFSGAATDTLSGLDHLEGETVSVLAGGAVHPDRTVSGGSITLDREVTEAVVGLNFITAGMTERMHIGGARIGTGQGKQTRIQRVSFFFYNTVGFRFGRTPDDTLDRIIFRSGSDLMDQSPPLIFTGYREAAMPQSGWSDEPTVYFEQDQPLPMTLQAVAPFNELNER